MILGHVNDVAAWEGTACDYVRKCCVHVCASETATATHEHETACVDMESQHRNRPFSPPMFLPRASNTVLRALGEVETLPHKAAEKVSPPLGMSTRYKRNLKSV